jgi:hypothetical protein
MSQVMPVQHDLLERGSIYPLAGFARFVSWLFARRSRDPQAVLKLATAVLSINGECRRRTTIQASLPSQDALVA